VLIFVAGLSVIAAAAHVEDARSRFTDKAISQNVRLLGWMAAHVECEGCSVVHLFGNFLQLYAMWLVLLDEKVPVSPAWLQWG
jgi:hypothetical protein